MFVLLVNNFTRVIVWHSNKDNTILASWGDNTNIKQIKIYIIIIIYIIYVLTYLF